LTQWVDGQACNISIIGVCLDRKLWEVVKMGDKSPRNKEKKKKKAEKKVVAPVVSSMAPITKPKK
jgi:hypothetical protein